MAAFRVVQETSIRFLYDKGNDQYQLSAAPSNLRSTIDPNWSWIFLEYQVRLLILESQRTIVSVFPSHWGTSLSLSLSSKCKPLGSFALVLMSSVVLLWGSSAWFFLPNGIHSVHRLVVCFADFDSGRLGYWNFPFQSHHFSPSHDTRTNSWVD